MSEKGKGRKVGVFLALGVAIGTGFGVEIGRAHV